HAGDSTPWFRDERPCHSVAVCEQFAVSHTRSAQDAPVVHNRRKQGILARNSIRKRRSLAITPPKRQSELVVRQQVNGKIRHTHNNRDEARQTRREIIPSSVIELAQGLRHLDIAGLRVGGDLTLQVFYSTPQADAQISDCFGVAAALRPLRSWLSQWRDP